MRVLIDENIPRDFGRELSGHEVATVQGKGWSGVSNGELLRRAAGLFDVLVTMDSKMEYQQAVGSLSFGVVVIRAKSNRIIDLLPLLPEIMAVLIRIRPGEVLHVGL